MNTFENNLLDLVTAVVMVPVAVLCLLWQGVVALWPYRQYIGLAVAVAGVGWLFVAVPALPLGLAITAVVGWATMPRSPRNGGWGRGVSWNSEAVTYANS